LQGNIKPEEFFTCKAEQVTSPLATHALQ
jgi:hypothetical protein